MLSFEKQLGAVKLNFSGGDAHNTGVFPLSVD